MGKKEKKKVGGGEGKGEAEEVVRRGLVGGDAMHGI